MIKIFIYLFIFLWKIHNLRDYSIYRVTINVFFASNLKIGRILRSMIRSTILPTCCDLRKIPILRTLALTMYAKKGGGGVDHTIQTVIKKLTLVNGHYSLMYLIVLRLCFLAFTNC